MAGALLKLLRNEQDGANQERVQRILATNGYAEMNKLLEELKQAVKQFTDETVEEVEQLLLQAKQAIPEPGSISPAWQDVWAELETMKQAKQRVLETIPPQDRDGEWQVLLDNPYVHQDVVCYPGLSFMEAAYLYGYFMVDLKRNEYVKIQKIQTMMYEFGEA